LSAYLITRKSTYHLGRRSFFCHITDEKGEEKPVKREIRFIDSFRFMALSLDPLIKNFDPEQCKNVKKFCLEQRKFDLLKRKGVYLYDYIDSVDKLAETSLPPKEAFYSWYVTYLLLVFGVSFHSVLRPLGRSAQCTFPL